MLIYIYTIFYIETIYIYIKEHCLPMYRQMTSATRSSVPPRDITGRNAQSNVIHTQTAATRTLGVGKHVHHLQKSCRKECPDTLVVDVGMSLEIQ